MARALRRAVPAPPKTPALTTARRQRARGKAALPAVPPGALRARRKFLKIFPGGFRDEDYLELERDYKWKAHEQWQVVLARPLFSTLLKDRRHAEIAAAAIRVESRTNLLFSFEKMALRDAVKSPAGAKAFSVALFDLLHGDGAIDDRFDRWVAALAELPRRQTRVLTWPLASVFGFIAQPREHFFLKPTVTRAAARRYGRDLPYASRPSGEGYRHLLAFVDSVRRDIRDLRPRDMIDLQSFLWVQGSDEYAG